MTRCELPITGLIGGKLYETVIDRTFVDENGVRWIIDYKTSSHEGGGLEKLSRCRERSATGSNWNATRA